MTGKLSFVEFCTQNTSPSHSYTHLLGQEYWHTCFIQTTTVMNDRLQLHVKYQVTIAASTITMTLIEYSHLLPAAKFRHP